MTADDVVHLKRRVRNVETELFEWRKCECRLTDDGRLVLSTVEADDDDETDAQDKSSETPCVVMDLAWQLQSLEQKRKCKTRCELQFVVVEGSTKYVCTEELMAPSPRHCVEWIELVHEAEKRAKRQQSIRQGTATAAAVAAINATLASSTSSSVMSSSRDDLPPTVSVVPKESAPFDASVSSVSATSVASAAKPSSVETKQQCSQQRSSVLLSQHNRYDESDDDPSSPLNAISTVPVPRTSSYAQQLAVVRQLLPHESQRTAETTYDSLREAHLFDGDDDSEVERDDADTTFDTRSKQRPPRVKRMSATTTAIPRHKPSVILSPSSIGSTHPRRVPSSPSSGSSVCFRRGSSTTLLPSNRRVPAASSSSRHRSPPSRSNGADSAAAVAASIHRLRRRERQRVDDDTSDVLDGRGDTREELDILMRVETALRHLERENALAKERETALAHQVSSLQDALRIRTAEKSHLETHVQQLTRDKDEWKQAAQRAERALAQLQDELMIAQEETQLQHSERHRLKHQNKELLSQVHRLDSIVYGRF